MIKRCRYRKKSDQFCIAIQLNLETEGLTYKKWGAEQRCKRGDWLVDNQGDIYSVDSAVFAQTYRKTEAGRYVKTTVVWAEIAVEAGSVKTKEGQSHYARGDYIVSNNEEGSDSYCISAERFAAMYDPDTQ